MEVTGYEGVSVSLYRTDEVHLSVSGHHLHIFEEDGGEGQEDMWNCIFGCPIRASMVDGMPLDNLSALPKWHPDRKPDVDPNMFTRNSDSGYYDRLRERYRRGEPGDSVPPEVADAIRRQAQDFAEAMRGFMDGPQYTSWTDTLRYDAYTGEEEDDDE